ncbi:39S ribosomal protein L43, mitochondrial [Polyrhizophydium stewartii]|uniref:Large ribosomal subunit protein mL43 n=1 Tax=Polyrhizophydium stewartii TaxID=2732419 RepID=A0ABR4NGN2_9FUNG
MSIAAVPVKRFIRQLKALEPKLQKKLLPEKDLDSRPVNGVGAFVPPICRLTLFYDSPRHGAGGDSRGMVDFLTSQLLDNAAKRPYVEFSVTHRSGPPELLATYSNGTQRSILVKRKTPSEIQKSLDLLCNSWGPAYAARKFPSPVRTGPGSTLHEAQNQWDPFHAKHVFRP